MSESKEELGELITEKTFLTYMEQYELDEIGKFVDYLVILNNMSAGGDETKVAAEQEYRSQNMTYLTANKNQKWRAFSIAYRAKLN